ncbi:MAG: hypothetical protein ABFS32_15805 [Bacteroidota bacterium]
MIFIPWLKYRTKKAEKSGKDLRKSVGYSQAENIGILYYNNDHNKIDAAEKLSTLIKMDGKKVKVIAYEKKSTVKHLPYDTFTKENFSFWGTLIGKPINDFVDLSFDFVICLDRQPNIFLQNILATSKAKCRIGRYKKDNQQLFEMLIEEKKPGNDWVNSVYDYLKIIS